MVTWLIALASIIGTVANVYRRRWCFGVWLVTNAFWTIYDLSIGAYAQGALMAVYFGLSALGLYQWKTQPSRKED